MRVKRKKGKGKEREKECQEKKSERRGKLGQMEAAWCKAETERADEHMMKNICQYQPFIARRERAELFNSLAFLPHFYPRSTPLTNRMRLHLGGGRGGDGRPRHLPVAQAATVFSLFVTAFSHMTQMYKPPVEFMLIVVICD